VLQGNKLLLRKSSSVVIESEVEATACAKQLHEVVHCGVNRLEALIREKYYFRDIRRIARDVVKCCAVCQTHTTFKVPKRALRPVVSKSVFSHLQLDLIELPLTRRGNRYVIMLIDIFSKYLWVLPIPTKESEWVVRFVDEILSTIGRFDILQSDHGTEFVNKQLKSWAHANNIGT
jgi:hypothetical protein